MTLVKHNFFLQYKMLDNRIKQLYYIKILVSYSLTNFKSVTNYMIKE